MVTFFSVSFLIGVGSIGLYFLLTPSSSLSRKPV
jgi:hypothetical protein